jgi:hypothetical protein
MRTSALSQAVYVCSTEVQCSFVHASSDNSIVLVLACRARYPAGRDSNPGPIFSIHNPGITSYHYHKSIIDQKSHTNQGMVWYVYYGTVTL